MLESIHPGSPGLSENPESLSRLVCATEQADGNILIARCAADGRHLDLFRFNSSRRVLETLEVAKQIAAKGVVITAMAWLPVSTEHCLLCVGFSHGGISLFTPRGAVCLSFLLIAKPVIRLRLGPHPTSDEPQKVVALIDGGMVALFTLESLKTAAFGMLGDASADASFQYDLHEFKDCKTSVDVCLIEHTQDLEDVWGTHDRSAVAALGSKPFLSLHWVPTASISSRSILGSATSALTSYAKSWMPFRGRSFDPLTAPPQLPAGMMRPADIQVPLRGKPEALQIASKFIDPTRVGERLEPAPLFRGRKKSPLQHHTALAASCDGFGRVGLFCLETLRCLHLWKGYRDAQVGWLQRFPENDNDCILLGLVIYAPRRGLLELWDVVNVVGPRRIDASTVDLECHLISSNGRVFLLRANGRLDRVTWRSSISAPPTDMGTVGEASHTSELCSDDFDSLHGDDIDAQIVQLDHLQDHDLDGVGDNEQLNIVSDATHRSDDEEQDEQAILSTLQNFLRLDSCSDAVETSTCMETILAKWDNPLILESIQRLESPTCLEQSIDHLLAAHLCDNKRILLSTFGNLDQIADSSKHSEDWKQDVPKPTEVSLSALSHATHKLLSHDEGTSIANRLSLEISRLSLYNDLLHSTLAHLNFNAEFQRGSGVESKLVQALIAQSEHLRACSNIEPANGGVPVADSVIGYATWLSHESRILQSEDFSSIDEFSETHTLLTLSTSWMTPSTSSSQYSLVVLPYIEFIVCPCPPLPLVSFVCQPLLFTSDGQQLMQRAVQVLQWESTPSPCKNITMKPLVSNIPASLGQPSHSEPGLAPCDPRICADHVLRWFCGTPLIFLASLSSMLGIMPTPYPASENHGTTGAHTYGDCLFPYLQALFAQHPGAVLDRIGYLPPRFLPHMCFLCCILSLYERGSCQNIFGGRAMWDTSKRDSHAEDFWPMLATQLIIWLRLICALVKPLGAGDMEVGGNAEQPIYRFHPQPTVHRLLFAWPVTLANYVICKDDVPADAFAQLEHALQFDQADSSETDQSNGDAGFELFLQSCFEKGLPPHECLGTSLQPLACIPALHLIWDCPWFSSAAVLEAGSKRTETSSLPSFVATNCILLTLWHHLQGQHISSKMDPLAACISWIKVLPASIRKCAAAFYVFEKAFLNHVPSWLELMTTTPHMVDAADLDRALYLLRVALDLHPESEKFHVGHGICATCKEVSPRDWSGDMASELLHAIGQRLAHLHPTIRSTELMLRMMQVVVQARVPWDIGALFTTTLSDLGNEARLLQGDRTMILESPAVWGSDCGPTPQERGLRLELLFALGTSGHFDSALSLARDAGLEEDLHAVLLRHKLHRGLDAEIDVHLARLQGKDVAAALVSEAIRHRLAAVIQILCGRASADATVLSVVSPDLLERFIDTIVEEATVKFVSTDIARALHSSCALGSHHLLQEFWILFEDAVGIAKKLLEVMDIDTVAVSDTDISMS